MTTSTSTSAPVDVLSAKLRSLRSPSASAQSSATAAPSAPAPAAATSLTPPPSQDFVVPQKRIVTPKQLARWESSEACAELLAWIAACNDAVVGKKLGDEVVVSQPVQSLLDILSSVQKLVEQTPPERTGTSRFGDSAFRTLHAKIAAASPSLHAGIEGLSEEAQKEVRVYFDEAWGNARRIDYGSGMELNFACWLFSLTKLGILSLERDAPALVLRVFWAYIQVMRVIQSTYWLEPAGSHGVWGLDDYHFLPFLWGSAQLKDHKHLRPKAIHDAEIVEEFSKDYMYLACIRFINSIKTASLRWHSPMLDDISGVRTWAKVNEGMQKMYRAEVLLKLPIAQHIFFGSLLAFPAPAPGEEEDEAAEEDEHGHFHAHAGPDPNAGMMATGQALPAPTGHAHGDGAGKEGQAAGWGDCCGIPIPSAFAAAEEQRRKDAAGLRSLASVPAQPSAAVRRVPFD